nr:carbon storage regulator [uncultured Oscillibacter sp.]
MLSLSLPQGEHMTIAESVVVQADRISGERCKLMVQAPREVPILRGEVLERQGGQPPGCVVRTDPWRKPELR